MKRQDHKVGTGGSEVDYLKVEIPEDAQHPDYDEFEENNAHADSNGKARLNYSENLSSVDPATQRLINTHSESGTDGKGMLDGNEGNQGFRPHKHDLAALASPSSPITASNADGDINIKPSRVDLSPMGSGRRSFYNRTFSKLQKGSLRGGIFNMISSALGGGVLSLSYVFVLSGWIIGLLLLGVGCIAGIWSNLIIAKIAIKHKLKNLDEMAFKAGGNCLRKFLQIMMVVYATGSCTGYQIFLGNLLTYFFEQVLPASDSAFLHSFEFRLLVNVPIAGVILLPLSLKRDMSALAFAGVLSVASLTFTLLVLVVETPFYWREYRNAPTTVLKSFELDWNFLTSFSLVVFAYTCQMSLMPVYSELVKPNYQRISKIVHRALFVDAIFYYTIACAGYFSMFNYTSDVVIERPALSGFDPDYFSLIAAVAICVVLFAAFPSNYNPCRNQFFLLVFKEAEFSNKANFVVTLIFIVVTCSVAVFYPNVSAVLSILGGLCSVSICYTVPLYAWVKLSDKPWHAWDNLAPLLFFVPLITLGYASVGSTVYLIASGNKFIGDRPDIHSFDS